MDGACTKRLYFHFRYEIWRHHRVSWPWFPLKRGNFGDSAINERYIAYFSLRMRHTAVFPLPVKNPTSSSCSSTPISSKIRKFRRFAYGYRTGCTITWAKTFEYSLFVSGHVILLGYSRHFDMEKRYDDVVTLAAAAAAVIVIRHRRRRRLQHRRLLWCKPWLQARDSGRMSDYDLDLRPKPKVWAGSPNVKNKLRYKIISEWERPTCL